MLILRVCVCVCVRARVCYIAIMLSPILGYCLLKIYSGFYLSDWDSLFQLLKIILKPDSVN